MDEYASSNSYSVVGRTYFKLYRYYRTKPINENNILNKYRVVFICAWPS